MANVTIPDLTALGANVAAGDLLEIADVSNANASRKVTQQELIAVQSSPTIDSPTLTGTTIAATVNATSANVTNFLPVSNDGAAIGASGTAFSDLFLASGAVINFNAGNYTLTHSAGVLTANLDFRVTTAGTNTASVVTVGGTQTVTSKTINGANNTLTVRLANDVSGDLPLSNLAPSSAASKLLGRGDSGAGDFQEITLGSGLTMTGTTLSSSGGGGGTAWPRKYKSGKYYMTNQAAEGDAVITPDLNTVYFHPFPVGEALTIDRLTCGVQTGGGASSTVRLGIYSDTDGAPDALVLDAGTVAADSTGYKEITVSQALSAGTLYWIATVWQTAAVGSGALRATATGSGADWVGQDSASSDPRTCTYVQTGVSGALPANATPSTSGAVTIPPSIKIRAT